MPGTCSHIWVSNSGEGGPPVFKKNGQHGAKERMHVKCESCNARTWFTQDQWLAMDEE